VGSGPRPLDYSGLVALREVRAFIRTSNARMGVVFFAVLYGLGSLLGGGMLILARIPGGYTTEILLAGGPGSGSWNYPGLLIVAPWGVLTLPFFATVAMVAVAVGVGYGMTIAFLLAVRLLRPRRAGGRSSGALGAVGGLTPAMISLVTLGACCSTTAAATAGVGLVAASSGTTVTTLLVNNWFLGVFQIVIVWVALVGQEMLLRVYGGLFGPFSSEAPPSPAPALGARSVLAGCLRAALLVGGLLWALSVPAQWTTVSPLTAGPGYWFQWVGEHWAVAGVALTAAFFPAPLKSLVLDARPAARWVFSSLLLLCGLAVLVWLPAPLPAWGLDSLTNQVLGSFGLMGLGSSVDPWAGPAFAARLVFEYALLGGFAVALALWPRRALDLATGASGPTGAAADGKGASAPSPAGPGPVPGSWTTDAAGATGSVPR
jgi:hypothetical protein